MTSIKRIIIVLANYCPHCVPVSINNAKKMAEDFGVPLQKLNIELPTEEKLADELIKKHGDWSEDYLIPQIFVKHIDGRINHIFTGFSEAVTVTTERWSSLLSSNYYQNLKSKNKCKKNGTESRLLGFVEKYLRFRGQCRRHCNAPSSFVGLWNDAKCVVGAYVCPDSYVSKVVYFSVDPDITWFKTFLTSQVTDKVVKDRDLRPATRYGWELGDGASNELKKISPNPVMKEVYWTIYPTTEEEKQQGVFLCLDLENDRGCRRLFVQNIKSRNKLCSRCR